MTECTQSQFEFEAHFSRRVVAEFSAEQLRTEGGSLLLRAADRKIGLLRRVVRCFTDARDPQRIEHELSEVEHLRRSLDRTARLKKTAS